MAQYGFYIENDRCIKCYACQTACKSWKGVEIGLGMNLMTVHDVWEGTFPDCKLTFLQQACWHCAEPPCVEMCPNGALSKRSKDGIVVVDADLCIGCQTCFDACPWNVPVYGKSGIMQICDLCVDRLEKGEPAVCEATCAVEAIHVGLLSDLLELGKAKNAKMLAHDSGPSVLFPTTGIHQS